MARPIRIELSGAMYHVIVRGSERKAVSGTNFEGSAKSSLRRSILNMPSSKTDPASSLWAIEPDRPRALRTRFMRRWSGSGFEP